MPVYIGKCVIYASVTTRRAPLCGWSTADFAQHPCVGRRGLYAVCTTTGARKRPQEVFRHVQNSLRLSTFFNDRRWQGGARSCTSLLRWLQGLALSSDAHLLCGVCTITAQPYGVVPYRTSVALYMHVCCTFILQVRCVYFRVEVARCPCEGRTLPVRWPYSCYSRVQPQRTHDLAHNSAAAADTRV
jgi:hypothetical protein